MTTENTTIIEKKLFHFCTSCAEREELPKTLTTTSAEYSFCSGCGRFDATPEDKYFAVVLEHSEICDCGSRVMHNNGGNYHHDTYRVVGIVEPTTLIDSDGYESIEYPSRAVEIRVTFNGGCTFCVARVVYGIDHTWLEGTDDDKRSIAAVILDCSFDEVSEVICEGKGMDIDEVLITQAESDKSVYATEQEMIAEAAEEDAKWD